MPKTKKPNKEQRKLADDWNKLNDKWANVQPFAGRYGGSPTGRVVEKYVPPMHSMPIARNTDLRVRSVPDSPGGSTALKAPQQYTGTAMLGVATMHKSNSVPVFSSDDAKDITRMRR